MANAFTLGIITYAGDAQSLAGTVGGESQPAAHFPPIAERRSEAWHSLEHAAVVELVLLLQLLVA
jgi:hypothetical protein